MKNVQSTFEIVVHGGNTTVFTGTMAQAKKAIQEVLIAQNSRYAGAYAYFDGKYAACSLTPTNRLRMKVREVTVQAAKPVYGNFVKVVGVVGKYCDSMGAFEVLTVQDDKGQEYSVDNRYDVSACFRTMDDAARLAYAIKSV